MQGALEDGPGVVNDAILGQVAGREDKRRRGRGEVVGGHFLRLRRLLAHPTNRLAAAERPRLAGAGQVRINVDVRDLQHREVPDRRLVGNREPRPREHDHERPDNPRDTL